MTVPGSLLTRQALGVQVLLSPVVAIFMGVVLRGIQWHLESKSSLWAVIGRTEEEDTSSPPQDSQHVTLRTLKLNTRPVKLQKKKLVRDASTSTPSFEKLYETGQECDLRSLPHVEVAEHSKSGVSRLCKSDLGRKKVLVSRLRRSKSLSDFKIKNSKYVLEWNTRAEWQGDVLSPAQKVVFPKKSRSFSDINHSYDDTDWESNERAEISELSWFSDEMSLYWNDSKSSHHLSSSSGDLGKFWNNEKATIMSQEECWSSSEQLLLSKNVLNEETSFENEELCQSTLKSSKEQPLKNEITTSEMATQYELFEESEDTLKDNSSKCVSLQQKHEDEGYQENLIHTFDMIEESETKPFVTNPECCDEEDSSTLLSIEKLSESAEEQYVSKFNSKEALTSFMLHDSSFTKSQVVGDAVPEEFGAGDNKKRNINFVKPNQPKTLRASLQKSYSIGQKPSQTNDATPSLWDDDSTLASKLLVEYSKLPSNCMLRRLRKVSSMPNLEETNKLLTNGNVHPTNYLNFSVIKTTYLKQSKTMPESLLFPDTQGTTMPLDEFKPISGGSQRNISKSSVSQAVQVGYDNFNNNIVPMVSEEVQVHLDSNYEISEDNSAHNDLVDTIFKQSKSCGTDTLQHIHEDLKENHSNTNESTVILKGCIDERNSNNNCTLSDGFESNVKYEENINYKNEIYQDFQRSDGEEISNSFETPKKCKDSGDGDESELSILFQLSEVKTEAKTCTLTDANESVKDCEVLTECDQSICSLQSYGNIQENNVDDSFPLPCNSRRCSNVITDKDLGNTFEEPSETCIKEGNERTRVLTSPISKNTLLYSFPLDKSQSMEIPRLSTNLDFFTQKSLSLDDLNINIVPPERWQWESLEESTNSVSYFSTSHLASRFYQDLLKSKSSEGFQQFKRTLSYKQLSRSKSFDELYLTTRHNQQDVDSWQGGYDNNLYGFNFLGSDLFTESFECGNINIQEEQQPFVETDEIMIMIESPIGDPETEDGFINKYESSYLQDSVSTETTIKCQNELWNEENVGYSYEIGSNSIDINSINFTNTEETMMEYSEKGTNILVCTTRNIISPEKVVQAGCVDDLNPLADNIETSSTIILDIEGNDANNLWTSSNSTVEEPSFISLTDASNSDVYQQEVVQEEKDCDSEDRTTPSLQESINSSVAGISGTLPKLLSSNETCTTKTKLHRKCHFPWKSYSAEGISEAHNPCGRDRFRRSSDDIQNLSERISLHKIANKLSETEKEFESVQISFDDKNNLFSVRRSTEIDDHSALSLTINEFIQTNEEIFECQQEKESDKEVSIAIKANPQCDAQTNNFQEETPKNSLPVRKCNVMKTFSDRSRSLENLNVICYAKMKKIQMHSIETGLNRKTVSLPNIQHTFSLSQYPYLSVHLPEYKELSHFKTELRVVTPFLTLFDKYHEECEEDDFKQVEARVLSRENNGAHLHAELTKVNKESIKEFKQISIDEDYFSLPTYSRTTSFESESYPVALSLLRTISQETDSDTSYPSWSRTTSLDVEDNDSKTAWLRLPSFDAEDNVPRASWSRISLFDVEDNIAKPSWSRISSFEMDDSASRASLLRISSLELEDNSLKSLESQIHSLDLEENASGFDWSRVPSLDSEKEVRRPCLARIKSLEAKPDTSRLSESDRASLEEVSGSLASPMEVIHNRNFQKQLKPQLLRSISLGYDHHHSFTPRSRTVSLQAEDPSPLSPCSRSNSMRALHYQTYPCWEQSFPKDTDDYSLYPSWSRTTSMDNEGYGSYEFEDDYYIAGPSWSTTELQEVNNSKTHPLYVRTVSLDDAEYYPLTSAASTTSLDVQIDFKDEWCYQSSWMSPLYSKGYDSPRFNNEMVRPNSAFERMDQNDCIDFPPALMKAKWDGSYKRYKRRKNLKKHLHQLSLADFQRPRSLMNLSPEKSNCMTENIYQTKPKSKSCRDLALENSKEGSLFSKDDPLNGGCLPKHRTLLSRSISALTYGSCDALNQNTQYSNDTHFYDNSPALETPRNFNANADTQQTSYFSHYLPPCEPLEGSAMSGHFHYPSSPQIMNPSHTEFPYLYNKNAYAENSADWAYPYAVDKSNETHELETPEHFYTSMPQLMAYSGFVNVPALQKSVSSEGVQVDLDSFPSYTRSFSTQEVQTNIEDENTSEASYKQYLGNTLVSEDSCSSDTSYMDCSSNSNSRILSSFPTRTSKSEAGQKGTKLNVEIKDRKKKAKLSKNKRKLETSGSQTEDKDVGFPSLKHVNTGIKDSVKSYFKKMKRRLSLPSLFGSNMANDCQPPQGFNRNEAVAYTKPSEQTNTENNCRLKGLPNGCYSTRDEPTFDLQPSISKAKKAGGDGRCICACHRDEEGRRKRSLNSNLNCSTDGSKNLSNAVQVLPGGQPPPPPPPPGGPPPPPPPPPPGGAPPPPPPPPGPGPPPPPPPKGGPPPVPGMPPKPPGPDPELEKIKLPQQEHPKPKAKMKTINWNKIPNHKVVGKNNIWAMVAERHAKSPITDMGWSDLEGLFCQQNVPPITVSSSPKPGGAGKDTQDTIDRRKKEPQEINLLDGKRSLNVNIYLRQFRSSNEDIIDTIKEGNHDDFGAEKLRGLLKLLPETDEAEMLTSFDGDKSKLGNAEKFLLQLLDVSSYRLRIESMLLKEEFYPNVRYLQDSLNYLLKASDDIKNCKELREILYMVMLTGNFLNSGGYAGNAAGVKLSSLLKLGDIRANKPGMNLMHYLAQQAEKKNPQLLNFTDQLGAVEEAAKVSIDQLKTDITNLETRVKKMQRQMGNADPDIQEQMEEFLKEADETIKDLQEDVIEMEKVREEMAEFIAEDNMTTFRLEECFKSFQNFCTRFKQAVAENAKRKEQEAQAEQRRKQREEQMMLRRRSQGISSQRPSSIGSEPECNIMDSLLSDIRSGFVGRKGAEFKDSKQLRKVRKNDMENGGCITSEDEPSLAGSPRIMRKRMGSFSGAPGSEAMNGVENSPDVTPNGSLRRRRSRVPSEEDDSNLMEFLYKSGMQDGSRERRSWAGPKSYGSLDRSLARRSRGGRKRMDLLTADFTPPSQDDKPRAVRQKVEAWLDESEKESRSRRRDEGKTNGAQTPLGPTLSTVPETEAKGNKAKQHDWKPHIETTDVVGTMEVIEGAQADKDKAQWRKSVLNTSSSSEAADLEARRLRRLRSRSNIDQNQAVNALQVIKEMKDEDKKAQGGDSLKLYFRRPSQEQGDSRRDSLETNEKRRADSIESNQVQPTALESALRKSIAAAMDRKDALESPFASRARRGSLDSPEVRRRNADPSKLDKIDIDAENIETPPVRRKPFGNVRAAKNDSGLGSSPKEGEGQDLLTRRRGRSSGKDDLSDGSEAMTPRLERRNQMQTDKEKGSASSSVPESPLQSGDSGKPPDEIAIDEEMGDGNFNRYSSMRRTRRGRSKPENVRDQSVKREANNTDTAKQSQQEDAEQSDSKNSKTKSLKDRLKEIKKTEDPLEVSPENTLKLRRQRRSQSNIEKADIEKALQSINQTSKELSNLNGESKANAADQEQNVPEAATKEEKKESESWRAKLTRKFRSPSLEKEDVGKSTKDSDKNLAVNDTAFLRNSRSRSFIDTGEENKRRSMPFDNSGVSKLLAKFESKPAPAPVLLRRTSITDTPRPHSAIYPPEINKAASNSRPVSRRISDSDAEHDKDEGFEETQSLISDTPSQGTDTADGRMRKNRYDVRMRDNPQLNNKPRPTSLRVDPPAQRSAPQARNLVTSPVRTAPASTANTLSKASSKTSLRDSRSSLRNSVSNLAASKKGESDSRASLRSSRSSLTNSTTSVSTARPNKPSPVNGEVRSRSHHDTPRSTPVRTPSAKSTTSLTSVKLGSSAPVIKKGSIRTSAVNQPANSSNTPIIRRRQINVPSAKEKMMSTTTLAPAQSKTNVNRSTSKGSDKGSRTTKQGGTGMPVNPRTLGFMRPTASSVAREANAEPVKRVKVTTRNISLQRPRQVVSK